MKDNKIKRYRRQIYKTRFGIEIETEFPEKVNIEQLYDRYRKLLNSWAVVHDGSLVNGLEFRPKDSNHLHYSKESFDEISEVLHIIKKHKGIANPKTTGCHIHIDASKFTEEEIIKIIKELVAREQYIVQDFKVDKDRLDNTCQLIKKSDIKGLKSEDLRKLRIRRKLAGDYPSLYPDIPILNDKYYILNLLNLSRYNSLEFRLFQGTLSIREIKRNVKAIFEFLVNALERE